MPPVFKKAKAFVLVPSMRHSGSPSADPSGWLPPQCQGLADTDGGGSEDDAVPDGGAPASPSGSSKAGKQRSSSRALDEQQQGHIGAYYPPASSKAKGGGALDQLRARVESSLDKLQAGRIDQATRDEVLRVLSDQQHQLDLLLRGQSSLRSNMSLLRLNSRDSEAKHKEQQQQIEQQHDAALRDMESKLERAIEQVQQLQHTARSRQQQDAASTQASLQALGQDVAALRSKADEQQAALDSKTQALSEATQRVQQLESQLADERAAHEQQGAKLSAQLEEVARDCEAALAEAEARSAALRAAEAQLAAAQGAADELQALRAQHLHLQASTSTTQQDAAQQVQQLECRCEEMAQQLQAAQAEHAAAASGQQSELDAARAELQVLRRAQADMQAQLAAAQAALEQAAAERGSLQAQRDSAMQLQDELSGLKQELAAAVAAQAELRVQRDAAESARLALQAKSQQEAAAATEQGRAAAERQRQLEAQLDAARAQLADVSAALEAATQRDKQHVDELAAAEGDGQKLQWRLAALQTELQKAQRTSTEQLAALREELQNVAAQVSTAQATADKRVADAEQAATREVDTFRQRWREEFDKRRKLHNLVSEYRGNIRVIARVRPLIEKERAATTADGGTSSGGAGGGAMAVRVLDDERLEVAGSTLREYEFDRVFGPQDGQLEVYREVSGLVTSVLDGYNACIVAYGQTGSGKTYTIDGPPDDPGINSRALAELFELSASRASDIAYTFSASVVEIYNEQIFDLLTGSRDTGDKLDIKESPQGGLFIPGLRIEGVSQLGDVQSVLQKGKQHRSTFATNMNEHSSRSHLVLTIHIKAQELAKDVSWCSKLHLIDLAGSERVSRSGAEGERLKEAAAINKSLSALGDVVAALQQRTQRTHVPYRNSKLTRLLEDSLGGSSKTLLLVNCSPAAENAGETRCSLDFAARARKVELGAAVKSEGSASCSSPGAAAGGRESPMPGTRSSTPASSGGAAGSGGSSASLSPRPGPRGAAGDLRHAASRRGAAAAPRE